MSKIEELTKKLSETDAPEENVNIYIQLIEAYRSIHDYQKSKECAYKGIDIAKSINDIVLLSDVYIGLSITLSVEGHNLQAVDCLEKAYEFSLLAKCDRCSSSALINLGLVQGLLGEFSKSLESLFKAIDITKTLNNPSRLASLYSNIGIVYRRIGNYGKALEYAKLSLKMRLKDLSTEDLVSSLINIGNIYKLDKDNALAMGYYKRALKLIDQHGIESKYSTILLNMANLYQDKKEYFKCIDMYIKSIEYAEKYKDVSALIISNKELGKVYFLLNHEDKGFRCLLKALEYSESYQDNDIILSLSYDLSNFYTQTKDYENANIYLRKVIDQTRKTFSEKMTHEVAQLQAKFDYEQKIKENELYRLRNVALVQSNELIESQKRELEILNKSKDSILSVVSHDLKNVIGGIYSITELLKNEKATKKARRYYELLESSCEKGLNLVKMLLESNLIEFPGYTLDLQEIDLNFFMKMLISNIVDMGNKKNIRIEFKESLSNVRAAINTEKFSQIIDNLINNAIKFSYPESLIIVSTEKSIYKDREYAVVRVKDFGIGISKENQAEIFKKFSKAGRKGTAGEKSVGLGLSIVKRLVELHQGEICFESEVDRGSEFFIYLPLS